MKHLISQWISVFLLICLAACNLPESAAGVPVSGGARTWFDAPLDGTSLRLAPYPVVIHTYDPGGVAQVEFSVNGVVLENLKPSSSSGLSEIDYTWDPKTTGNFVLRARSQGQGGTWNSEAQVSVTIGDFTPTLESSTTPTLPATLPPTPVVTFTPTWVNSFTPTTVPSFTATPVPVGLTFNANISTSQIYAGSCGTNQVTIQAYVSNPSLITGVTLFLKLKNQSTGESTSWNEGDPMNSSGSGWYQRTVSATSIPGYDDYKNSWILYQFVATSGGSIVGRSPVYSDIGLSTCAAPPIRIEPPQFEPIITITPVRGRPPALRRAPTLIPLPR